MSPSFTAGTDDRVLAAALAGFTGGLADSLINPLPDVTTVLEVDNRGGAIGTGSNTGPTITLMVDLDPVGAAAALWNGIDGIGVFSGSFIIRCGGSERRGSRESSDKPKQHHG